MPITNKDSILKLYYEANGQQEMFGRDNLQFKTVNHPRPHHLVDLCNKFKLKQITPTATAYPFTETNFVEIIGTLGTPSS